MLGAALAISAGLAPFIGLAILSMALALGTGLPGSAALEFLTGLAALLLILVLITLDLVLDKLPGARRVWIPLGWALRAAVGALIGWAVSPDLTLLTAVAGAGLALLANFLRLRLAVSAEAAVPALGRVGALAAAEFLAAAGGALALASPLVSLAVSVLALAGGFWLGLSRRQPGAHVGDTNH